MKTTIYCFSSTGNSLAAAKQVGAVLGETEILSIAQRATVQPFAVAGERIGFVFPLHYGFLPLIVERFFEQVQSITAKEIFVLVNCHTAFGAALGTIRKRIEERGGTLSSAAYITTVDNYTPIFRVPSPDSVAIAQSKAKAKVVRFSESIKAGVHRIEAEPPFLAGFWGAVMYRPWKKGAKQADKHFLVTGDCTKCGICAKVCPVANITVSDAPPAFHHNCDQCFACLHACPQGCIKWKKATEHQGRYRHGEVSAKELVELVGHR